MKEITKRWCDIKGYEGLYKISDAGDVLSFWKDKTKGMFLKLSLEDGYYKATLYNGVARKRFLVHVLVASYFCNNPGTKNTEVNHIDGCKLNIHYSNLEWTTRSENLKHAYRIGIKTNCGSKNPFSILKECDVLLIRKLRKEYGFKTKRLSWLFDVHCQTIEDILYGKTWRHI